MVIDNKSPVLQLTGESDGLYSLVNYSSTGNHFVTGVGKLDGGQVSVGYMNNKDEFIPYAQVFQIPFDTGFEGNWIIGVGQKLIVKVSGTGAAADYLIRATTVQ